MLGRIIIKGTDSGDDGCESRLELISVPASSVGLEVSAAAFYNWCYEWFLLPLHMRPSAGLDLSPDP